MKRLNYNSESFIFECCDIITIDENESNEVKISKLFLKYIDRTLYVTRDKELVGIITFGNFERYRKGRGELINRNFTFITNEDSSVILEAFKKSNKIKAIPLIDRNNRITKEYIKKDLSKTLEPLISFSEVKEAFFETKLVPCEKTYFILDSLTENEKKESINIFKETKESTVIISVEDIEFLEESLGSYEICIYNFCTYSRRNIVENIYKQQVKMMISLERKLNLELIFKLYKSVGLISSSREKPNTAETFIPICIEDLFWNDDKQRYEYLKESLQMPECIFSIFPFAVPYVYCKGSYIPVISKYMIGPGRYPETRPADIDLAYNIIPKLLENDISCIVINNPENEKEELMQFILGSLMDCKESQSYWCYDEKFWNEEIMQNQSKLWIPTTRHGYFTFRDCHEGGITYVNNERYVFHNPSNFKNTLFLFGPCLMMGSYVEDKFSLGNLLRDKVSMEYSIRCFGIPWEIYNLILREKDYKSGDIVVIMTEHPEYYKRKNIPVYSIINAYKKMPKLKYNVCHDYLLHVNELAMPYIVDEIYHVLDETEVFNKSLSEIQKELRFCPKNSLVKITNDNLPDGLLKWLEDVKQYIPNNSSVAKKVGSIVMNCNPFTYGHKYLIEKASKQVDLLLIFVVEEDKSFFKFSDRFNMVKKGIKEFSNVVVIPSGQYIISTITLPGYFQKDSQPNLTIDATSDLEVFSTVIAKQFHINYRFAGEEPIDTVTRQYNIAMKEVLPSYGINFVEIPRKEIEKQVISASLVRRYLNEKDYINLKKLVPNTTLEVLEERYFV